MRFFDAFETNNHVYIVMEIVEGGELFDRIIQAGRLSEKEAQHITYQLLGAVAHLHSNGVAHRDLKPQNILCRDETLNNIVLCDFGNFLLLCLGAARQNAFLSFPSCSLLTDRPGEDL